MVDLEPVTHGQHMRVTWVQSAASNTADPTAAGKELRLMGLDSANGKGVTALTTTVGNFFRPLITRDGTHVIYTDRSSEPKIYALQWDTGKITELGAGVAVTTWNEPGLTTRFIYALEEIDHGARDGLFGKRLVRFELGKPTEREIVWAQTPMDADGFQLSSDGRRASGLLPSPEASRLDFTDSTWKKLAAGTWPALAPDNSYLAWVLDADQATLQFFQPNQPEPWLLNFNSLPEIGAGKTIWHPRWGNHPELITFTGPYPLAPNQPSFKTGDGVNGEIFIGRLGAAAADIVSYVQITHNDRGDAYPDIWVENGNIATLTNFPQAPEDALPSVTLPWPAKADGLQFACLNGATDTPIGNEADPNNIRIPRVIGHQSSRFGREWELDISRGYFAADAASNNAIADACQASGAITVEGIFREARDGYQTPISVRLTGYRMADGSEALGIYRVENALVLRVRLGADAASAKVYPMKLANFRIESGRPYHFVISMDQETLRAYIDGSLLGETALEAKGFGAWTNGSFEIGDPQPLGEDQWQGSAEHVAVYSRALTAEEIGLNFTAIQPLLINRKPPERIQLQGVLESVTPVTPAQMEPYVRVLAALTYRVEKVESGVYQPKFIVVLHDVSLNRKPVPGVPSRIGQTYPLLVEQAAQHLELKSVGVLNETQLKDLPVYIEITPPARIKE